MAKRRADKDINHDNWEEDDEIEEAGQFQRANAEELKRRTIKVGRRTLSNSPVSSPFAKFGFGSTPGGTPKVASTQVSGIVNGKKAPASEDKDVDFLSKLKSLNECLLRWLKQHMEKSPYCDFTPVFADYQRHLQELREKNHKSAPSTSLPSPAATTVAITAPGPGSSSQFASKPSFRNLTSPAAEKNAMDGSGSSSRHDEKSEPAASRGEKPGSSLGGTPLFQFVLPPSGQNKPATANQCATDKEDENYVPPSNEFTAVEETDAVYSKRCKLFYKKGDSYVDRGIGMLYVKPLNGKHQLLMRADTNLGNILLNILLVPSLPVSRVGKNNLAIVCVPNPPLDSEGAPTTFLLRVKTEEDADQLRDTLFKYKGQEQ